MNWCRNRNSNNSFNSMRHNKVSFYVVRNNSFFHNKNNNNTCRLRTTPYDYKKCTAGLITTKDGCEEFIKCDTISDFICKCTKSIHYDMGYTHTNLLSTKVRIPIYPNTVHTKREKYAMNRTRPFAYGFRPGKDVVDIYMRWDKFKNTIHTAQEIRKTVKKYQMWLHTEKHSPVYSGQYVSSHWKRSWVNYYSKVVMRELMQRVEKVKWKAYFTERVISELPLWSARLHVLWKYPVPSIVERWPQPFDGRDWGYAESDTEEDAARDEQELFDEEGNINI